MSDDIKELSDEDKERILNDVNSKILDSVNLPEEYSELLIEMFWELI